MKTTLLVIMAAVLFTAGLFLYHNNARKSVAWRDAILAKDLTGEDVREEVRGLRRFTATHTNASVEFKLTGAYQRAMDEAYSAASPTVSGQIYAQAQAACASLRSSVAQADCVRRYVAAREAMASGPKPQLPSESDFHYSFISPPWAFDGATGLISASVLVGLAAAASQGRRLLFKP